MRLLAPITRIFAAYTAFLGRLAHPFSSRHTTRAQTETERKLFAAAAERQERTLFRTIDLQTDTEPAPQPSVTPSPRLRGRRKRLVLAGVAVPVIALVAALGAVAYFTSSGGGSASASVGTLNAPGKPGAVANGIGRVDVTWHQATLSTGTLAEKYYVSRYSGATLDGYACGTSPTGTTVPASAANGSGNFVCSDTGLSSAGPYKYTVTAVYNSWSAESVTSDPVTVSLVGPLDHFDVTPTTGTKTVGAPFTLTVTAKDASNLTITGYTGTIHFTSNDSQAALPGDYTFTGGDAGTHTFTNGATLKTAGTARP
jgi:hypothetical protein